MAVGLSALLAGRRLAPGRFLILISGRGRVDPRAIIPAGRIRSIEKNPMTSSGIEPVTFRLLLKVVYGIFFILSEWYVRKSIQKA
jgi:hypothetical protein